MGYPIIKMIKIKLLYVLILIALGVPLLSYVDFVRIGAFPFQQYLAINLWEAGILFVGIVLGGIIEW